jgi:hypothetical protein
MVKRVLPLFAALLSISFGLQHGSGATRCSCEKLYDISAQTRGGLMYGFIDCKGKVIIEPRFPSVQGFSDGVAVVNVERKVVGYKEDGHAVYEITDGIVDVNGKLVVLPKTHIISSFSEGLALAKIGDKLAYIDKSGKVAISIPDQVKVADVDYSPPGEYHFYGGLAGLRSEGTGIYLVDKQGNITLSKEPLYRYDKNGLAVIEVEGKQALVDGKGNYILGPQDNDIVESEGIYFTVPRVQNEKYKFINSKGELLFEHFFDDVGIFSEGLARVKVNGQWGYLDQSGKLKIPVEFEDARDFADGLAAVKSKGKWGFINKNGLLVILPKFDSAGDFDCGLAYVQQNKVKGYIDKRERWIWRENN